MAEGNGSTTKLLYWLLGIQGTFLVAVLTWQLSQFSWYQAKVQALELSVAGTAASYRYLETLATTTRQEQLARTDRFSLISEKMLLIDQRVTSFGLRLDAQSARILSLAERLDTIHDEGKSGEMGGYNPP